MAGPSSFWTPEMDARAQRLRSEGVSAGEIARLIGAPSRSAVLGRLWRLSANAAGGAATGRAAAPSRGRWRLPPMVPAAPVAQTPVECAPRAWTDRAAGECAYPVAGEGVAVLSCCNPTVGRGYCPGHRAAMFPDSRRRSGGLARKIADSKDLEGSPAMTTLQPKRVWR